MRKNKTQYGNLPQTYLKTFLNIRSSKLEIVFFIKFIRKLTNQTWKKQQKYCYQVKEFNEKIKQNHQGKC